MGQALCASALSDSSFITPHNIIIALHLTSYPDVHSLRRLSTLDSLLPAARNEYYSLQTVLV
jgi:hypothetical protein